MLDQQCRGATDHRSGHAGPTELQIGVGAGIASGRLILRQRNAVVRILIAYPLPRRVDRDHAIARGNQVRLDDVIDRRWTFGAVAGNFVVYTQHGVHRLRGISLRACRIVATVVAGGDDDHDSGPPGAFDGLAQRIELVALVDRMAQREVHHPDVEPILELDRVVDRRDHVAHGSLTLVVQHAQIDEQRARCDSAEGPRSG